MSVALKRWSGALLIWLMVGALASVGVSRGALQELENRTWDWRVRVTARPEGRDTRIKIIAIDQASLEHFASGEKIYWPWPRSLYNPVLQFLKKAGAKGVAFDLLFTESSTFVEDDREFARVIEETIPVVSAVAARDIYREKDGASLPRLAKFQNRDATTPLQYFGSAEIQRYSSIILPIDEILDSSTAIGNVTASADSDQIFRRTWAGALIGDTPVLNLPFALHAVTEDPSTMPEKLERAVTDDGAYLIKFFGPAKTYDTYSMHQIVMSWLALNSGTSPPVSLDDFRDAYVFIGGTAPGLLDVRSVPFPGAYSGVEVNATIFDNLIHNSFVRKLPRVAAVSSVLFLVAVACAMGLYLPLGQLLSQALLSVGWLGACMAAAYVGWWVPLIVPLLALGAVMVSTSFLQYQIEGRQHRFIRSAFRYYLSSEVIDRIVADPSSLRLGGERRELTILFSDISGFTGISERLPPDLLVQFLNLFLSEMSAIIQNTGGTLDKYQGDAIIAFWNAPLEIKDHRERGVKAAMQCQRRLRELSSTFKERFGIDVQMRIGLHTGTVSVGNFGSDQRFNYTMIGDAANVASRLEGVNKVFGTSIIVSEATKREMDSAIIWRYLGQVRVVGRNEPIKIYQPLDQTTDALRVRDIDLYNQGVSLLEGGNLVAAEAVFSGLVGDSVALSHLKRIRDQMKRGVFEVVWDLKEK